MNEIILQGYIRDIEFSHDIGNVEYGKANIVCRGVNGQEDDIISIRYKQFSNKYKEGDLIELSGNIRSYSHKSENKNKVDIYVFTYFDMPNTQKTNNVSIDGNICKIETISKTTNGEDYIHLILANNIYTKTKKLNNYIPCVAYGDVAEKIIKNYKVTDYINIEGALHSRVYKKFYSKDDIEFKVAHELVINNIQEKDNG